MCWPMSPQCRQRGSPAGVGSWGDRRPVPSWLRRARGGNHREVGHSPGERPQTPAGLAILWCPVTDHRKGDVLERRWPIRRRMIPTERARTEDHRGSFGNRLQSVGQRANELALPVAGLRRRLNARLLLCGMGGHPAAACLWVTRHNRCDCVHDRWPGQPPEWRATQSASASFGFHDRGREPPISACNSA
jgi:hypothetical protein